MKIIDEKGRLFGKINVIDLLIIVVVFALAAATFIKFRTSDSYMSKDTIIEYTLLVENIRTPTVDAINEKKDGILDYETKKEIGDIVDAEISGASELEMLNNGKYKEVEYKDKYDLLLTIQTKGTETADNYYTASGKKLVVGDTITIYNEYASTTGKVKSIKVME